MSFPLRQVLLLLGAVAAPATAQGTGGDPASETPPPRVKHTETAADEQRSWTLFTVCDRNGDDRIDLLEAASCALIDPVARDRSRFRLLDVDSSGFVEFPEFDARYREVIRRAGTFTLMVPGPIEFAPNPVSADTDEDPTLFALRASDRDRSGALSPEEFARFLEDNGADRKIVGGFRELDEDGSGGIDVQELAPMMQFMGKVWSGAPAETERRLSLPTDDRAADTDGDGLLDRSELDAALRLLSPSLSRWSDRIFSDADQNGSQSLGGDELHRGRRTARAALDTRPTESTEPTENR